MKVLIACEFSGIVRDAFISRGHDAMSCDLLPTEKLGPHLQGDAILNLCWDWDLIIAHPPCTYLSNSGARWLYNDKKLKNLNRWNDMEEGAYFFKEILNAPIKRICIENPIMHRYAKMLINKEYSQIIQPWQFGHGETKATCLWLKNLPILKTTNIVDGRNPRVHFASPSKERWKERSRTLQGIANAMADQWGNLD